MRVGIATDHGGFGLKEDLLAHLREAGHEVVDVGAHRLNPGDDYPDFVIPLARAVAAGKVERGVAVCGSGVGAAVCANKIPGVRAGLIHDHFSAQQGVEDDHHLYGREDRWTGDRPRPRRYLFGGRVQPSRATSPQAG
jgi:ribose 5-phosphate isomerase B